MLRNYLRRLWLAITNRDTECGHRWDDAVLMQTALGLLSDRYLQMADQASSEVGRARAAQIQQAGLDIRHALITGRIPSRLLTDAELEQHGTQEVLS